jgi:tetratricopeptide (TPR) repeat protein
MRRERARHFGGLVGSQLFCCIALSCALAPAAYSQSNTFLADAERLIREGRAADAHRLLVQHEAGLAGQSLYDYLYGVAALDAGHPRAAITALERVVANDPRSTQARLELGRAWYEAGDRAAAERQFLAALAQNPPPGARHTAEAYLRAINPPAAAPGGWSGGYEFGAGYDSNANASTSDTSFLGVTLDPANVEQSSSFLTAAGWFGHAGKVSSSRVETTGRIGHRWNPDAEFVDQTIASLGMALRFGEGPTVFRLGLGGSYGLLDGEAHHWNASTDFSLSHRFGDGWRTTGLLRAGQLRYEESDFPGLSVLDMDQLLAAFSLQRAGTAGHIGVTVFGGTEDERETGSPFGNDRFGFQFYGGSRTASGHDIGVHVAWQDIDFDDTPGFFLGLDRSDTAWSAAITAEIRDWPTAGMHLVPRIGWSRNESNIALYDYDRFEAGLTLTRAFR